MEERKRVMRECARAARRAIGPEARRTASEAVAARALALPELAAARSVLVFAAMPEELDPAPIAAALRASGARTAYPRVDAPGRLVLHWSDGDDLVQGPLGILEPAAASPEAEPGEIDAALVPGAAFDDSCCRLGLGGGYYDRLLARLRPGTVTVGLAYDEQMVDSVPSAAHDMVVDYVVTPTRTLGATRR